MDKRKMQNILGTLVSISAMTDGTLLDFKKSKGYVAKFEKTKMKGKSAKEMGTSGKRISKARRRSKRKKEDKLLPMKFIDNQLKEKGIDGTGLNRSQKIRASVQYELNAAYYDELERVLNENKKGEQNEKN